LIDYNIIKNIKIFEFLSNEDINKLSGIIEEVILPTNTFIFKEGDIGHEMYCIKKGIVEISKTVVANKRKPIAKLHTGQFFGEMALFDEQPRSANILTLEETLLFKITKKSFSSFLNLYPKIGVKIYKSLVTELCERVRNTDDKIQENIFWGFVSKSR